MTPSNLAIFIFGATVALFVVSMFARRSGQENKLLKRVMTLLGVIIIVLTVVYFKQRLAA